jgi:hypothetical protein
MWERTPEQIEKDHRAAEMRSRSMTYEQIGNQLGVTRQAAHQMVQRAINDIPKDGGEQALAMELMKLDYIERRAFVIATTKHPVISNGGKVVLRSGGVEIEDDTPILKALDTLLKVSQTRAKLLGLNAPTRTELTGKDGAPIQVEAIKERLELFLESLNG